MDTLTRQTDSLRACPPAPNNGGEEAFQAVLGLWRKRLADGWEPAPQPPITGEFASAFPWAQVKRSLAALVTNPLAPNNGVLLPRYRGQGGNPTLALICAGNTPLLAWPAMLFAVRHGVKLYVKMSRDETLWPRLLKESVAEISTEAAARIELGVWPGEDARTEQLIELSDAVIAYGSDATIDRLKTLAGEKPFQGFGHALSVGISCIRGSYRQFTEHESFADDVLAFDQQGCLSPSVIFVPDLEGFLGGALEKEAWSQRLPARTDPAECRRVREERDLASMGGAFVFGDPKLRWTMIAWPETRTLPPPAGLGIVHLITLNDLTRFGEFLGWAQGRLSSVGVAGELTSELRAAIEAEGVSRICRAGEMQTPPLSWKNGGVDLEAWIAGLGRDVAP